MTAPDYTVRPLRQTIGVAPWIAHSAGDEAGMITGAVIDFDHGVVRACEAKPIRTRRAEA